MEIKRSLPGHGKAKLGFYVTKRYMEKERG